MDCGLQPTAGLCSGSKHHFHLFVVAWINNVVFCSHLLLLVPEIWTLFATALFLLLLSLDLVV